MENKNNVKKKTKGFIIVLVILSFVFGNCSTENIVIENDYFRYEIAGNGKNLHFTDKTTGKDYLDSEAGSKSAYIVSDGERYEVTELYREKNNLNMKFGKSGVKADIHIREEDDRVTFKVTSVTGNIESFAFLNIPLKLEGMPYESFAACALSMNLFTHVRLLPPLQNNLWAKCYERFGPGLDLSENQALGVWIKGDGNGQILNFGLRSPRHLSHGARGDRFVSIDFTGWKYFELVEIESSKFSNYIWPVDVPFYVYDSYRHGIRFENVDKLQLWYNNLPAEKEVTTFSGSC